MTRATPYSFRQSPGSAPVTPLKVIFLADTRPGHYHLAEGVIAAVARLRPVEVTRIEVKRKWIVPTRWLRRRINAESFFPPRMFVPTREIAISLQDPPVPGKFKLPWLGVAQMIGLKKEVADYYGLTGQTAVQVGDVIKGMPADQAGLKPGTIIVKLNGQPLEKVGPMVN